MQSGVFQSPSQGDNLVSDHPAGLNSGAENVEGWKKKTILFLSSQTVSLFGSMLVQYAIIWHVTLITKSGSILTVLTLASFLPQILISLFAGVWADRYNRKGLIIAADALTALSTLALAICFLVGYQEMWLIFLVSGIRSVGAGIQSPAVGALLPQIVPTEKLIKINGINGTIQPLIMIASPVISGAMLSLSKLELIFFVDVITAAIAIGLLIMLKVSRFKRSEESLNSSGLNDLRAGLTYIWEHKTVRTLFIFFAVTFFLVTPVAFLTPLLVTRSFGSEVWRLTANEVTWFGGSILGGIVMTTWGGFKNRFRTIGLSCIFWAVLFTALGLSKDFVLFLVFMTLSGIPMPFFEASAITLMQETVRTDMQGRVFGAHQLIINTVMPVGMVVFGPLADFVSIELILIVSSILMAIPGLWIFYSKHGAQMKPTEDSGN
jgi:DHA3 family macrolide efflux protein-like MFS transporter